MIDVIIPRMLDALRSTPMPLPAQLEVSLRALAWAKLSQSDRLPLDLRLSPALIADPDRLTTAQAAIADMGGLLRQGFVSTWREDVHSPAARDALAQALHATEAGLLNQFDASDTITYLPSKGFAGWSLTSDIASLLVSLAGLEEYESVYVPWDAGGQIAARASAQGPKVFLESPIRSAIPALVGLLTDQSFEICFSDPISMPSYRDDGGLKQFDVGIAFPPLGQRHGFSDVDRDWFARFPERTQSGSVLAIRQLLAQTKRRIVIAVPNSLTFSPGAERALRDDLIRKGIVRSVITMPAGMLETTGIEFTILILEPSGGRQNIQFINAADGLRLDGASRGRASLADPHLLVDLVKNETESEFSHLVSNEDVLANDAQLQASRYILSDSAKDVQAKLKGAVTVMLGDIATTARPMPIVKDGSGTEVREIGAADIPAHGYIVKPGRTVQADDSPKNRQNFLRPLDIVLMVKGSVGKVGIVPDNVPMPGPGGWVAGQSAIVLRVTDDKIDPRALALQFRSPFGQQLIGQIVSGASIPFIQIRELMRLSVLVPDQPTAAAAAMALEKEGELQQQIETLEGQLAEVSACLWPARIRG